jgi:hypothetical protein
MSDVVRWEEPYAKPILTARIDPQREQKHASRRHLPRLAGP